VFFSGRFLNFLAVVRDCLSGILRMVEVGIEKKGLAKKARVAVVIHSGDHRYPTPGPDRPIRPLLNSSPAAPAKKKRKVDESTGGGGDGFAF
jgi:hypothetical protein